MSDPAGTRESGRERDGETRSSGKGSSFRGTRAGILPLLLFSLLIFPVFSSCGGKAPPPEPYFVAAARDALTSGNEWYARGCPKESLRYFDDALVAARLSDRADLTVASMNSRAAALMALSDYDGAASVLAKALSLSLNDPGTPALPAIFGNLGSVAHRMGRRGEAENYWERAASEAERLGESPAPYLGSLLRNAYDSKNAEALETNLARALGSLEHPGTDSASRADILNLAGLAALDRGDPETARARLSEALDLDRAGENVEGMAEDLEALAKLENMAGDFGKEAGFLDRAFYLRTALKDKKGAARIRASLEAAAKAGANADLAEYRRLTEHPNLFDPYASLCPDR